MSADYCDCHLYALTHLCRKTSMLRCADRMRTKFYKFRAFSLVFNLAKFIIKSGREADIQLIIKQGRMVIDYVCSICSAYPLQIVCSGCKLAEKLKLCHDVIRPGTDDIDDTHG